MLHDYHFVLNENAYFELFDAASEMGMSVSKLIATIFEKMRPFAVLNYLKAKEKKSKYENIAPEEEKRFDFHCYMEKNAYNKLKMIHII